MNPPLSRRDWLKVVGVAGAGTLLPSPPGLIAQPRIAAGPAGAPILPLTSTSEVFIPPRGRSFMKFSFDFPEPSVELEGLRFGFLVFTHENTYGLDQSQMVAEPADGGLRLVCRRFVWAGGQEHAPGMLEARFRVSGETIEWDVTAEMERPIKAITTIVRGVPRGQISAGGGSFFDPHDNEILFGYPFSGGDLFGPGAAGGMTTPLLIIQGGEEQYFFLSSLDDRVRTKRFYLQPGERSYRVEAVFESEGWKSERRLTVPTWRAGRVRTVEAALEPHFAHVERAYHLEPWDTRSDVPAWLRRVALVVTLHGMHYTGYVFNDYARMLEILRWIATQIAAERVLVFISAWDGRYYWDYPLYRPAERMGGEAGFARLIREGQRLGFHLMPMFGANAANREQAVYAGIRDAATYKIDGDRFDLNWVDWDNDRHQDGWLSYMNLGVESWRRWLTDRIAEVIERYGVDAYFLDIVGGWVNNPHADPHEGARRLVAELRRRYPHVLACGEMHYDALIELIPLYHAFGQRLARTHVLKFARFFQHLSHPAPGRGSTGVHEAGFGRFDPETLSLSEDQIPTLNVVDDTFDRYRDVMAAVIRRARERAASV
jgi:hypothetical protein